MKYFVSIIILACFSACAAAAPSASASYRVPIEVTGAAGGPIASSSYAVFGASHGLLLGVKGSANFNLREGFIAPAFPPLSVIVTAITPDSAYNTGTTDITDLAGAGFRTGAAVKFTRTAEADIIATAVNVVDPTRITCALDLTGKATGPWTVVVTNPDGQSGSLPDGFKIKTWSSPTQIMVYPTPYNPLKGPAIIIYQLEQDTNAAVLIYNISHELIFRQDFAAGLSGGRKGDNSLSWNGYSKFGELAANGVYFVRLVDRSNGKILAKGKIAVSR